MSTKNQDKPAPPKKPLSSYFLYTGEVRDKFKTRYPNEKPTELTKLMSEEYRSLPENQKQVYENRAKKLKEEYDKEVQVYVMKYGPIPKKERKSPEEENKKRVKSHGRNDEKNGKSVTVNTQKSGKDKDEDKKPKGKLGNLNKEKK